MRNRLFSIFALAILAFTLAQHRATAAVLSVIPAKVNAAQDQLAVVEVRLNSETQVVNAVEGKITYDPTALEVVDVSKAGSFLTLWAEGPKVDAVAGVVSFVGGVPNGSYVINGRVLSLVFRPKVLGATTIGVDTVLSSVRLNDGLGTATPLRAETSTVTVGVNDSSISLVSSTHPQENAWYNAGNVALAWTPTKDALYAFLLADEPAALPDERFGTAMAEATFTDVQDGAHYFILREKLPGDAWRTVAIRRVLVDTVMPEGFTPVLTRDVIPGKLALVFQTTDETSDIVRYTVQEGSVVADNAASPYTLLDQKQRAAIVVTAYDAAGNARAVTLAGSGLAPDRSSHLLILIIGGILVVSSGMAVYIVRRRR
ncbi:MAG: cohesin domain-containing protein [Patescibacteria group bacterium]